MNVSVGMGVARWVRCLPRVCETQVQIPTSSIKAGCGSTPVTLALGSQGESLELLGPLSLTKSVSSRRGRDTISKQTKKER